MPKFERWQPGKVVVIKSQSKGLRNMRLEVACTQLDFWMLKMMKSHYGR